MAKHALQSAEDFRLGSELRSDPKVVRALQELERQQQENPQSVRRQLLATALRLSPSMMPTLDKLLASCRERLGLDIPVEAYVYASPQFNAGCIKPEDGKLFVMFSSSLLEAFTGSELAFVVGHELGHHLFAHHDIPTGFIFQGETRPDPELALKLFSWSRFAEVSADRAGLACAQDKDGCARALFRLSAGFRTQIVKIDIDEFAAQVDEMRAEDQKPGSGPPPSDWFSTHPFSPLRVKALQLYAQGLEDEKLEAETRELLSLMAPNYLEEKSREAEAMRRLLFAACIVVAAANGQIDDSEVAVLESFFGAHSFHEELRIEAIRSDLPQRISAAKEIVGRAQLIQVLRDVALIAKADNRIGPEETKVMRAMAKDLDIGEALLVELLDQDLELD